VHLGRLTPAELVAGPRGRRLCFELVRQSADQLAGHQRPTLWWQLFMHEPGDLAEDLASAITDTDLDALGSAQDPRSLLPALADAVEWARYWQEPDEIDTALLNSELAAVLAPVATAVLAFRRSLVRQAARAAQASGRCAGSLTG